MIKIPEESASIRTIGNRNPPKAHKSPKTTAICMNSFLRDGNRSAADPITAIGVPMIVGIKAVALAISDITYAATPTRRVFHQLILTLEAFQFPEICNSLFHLTIRVSYSEATAGMIPT